jgi:hypothetical protein
MLIAVGQPGLVIVASTVVVVLIGQCQLSASCQLLVWTHEGIVDVSADLMTTVEMTEVNVVKTVAETVDGRGVKVEAMIVVGTVVVGVMVKLTSIVDVDVLPGASQLQNSLIRVLAMLSKFASREVLSVVVTARFSLTEPVMVVVAETVVRLIVVAVVNVVVEVETSICSSKEVILAHKSAAAYHFRLIRWLSQRSSKWEPCWSRRLLGLVSRLVQ